MKHSQYRRIKREVEYGEVLISFKIINSKQYKSLNCSSFADNNLHNTRPSPSSSSLHHLAHQSRTRSSFLMA